MSKMLVRSNSVGGKSIAIVPNVYTTLTKEERFLPTAQQNNAPTNKIKSTRYSVLTFIPIALFLQYKKVVVCVYTFNAIL